MAEKVFLDRKQWKYIEVSGRDRLDFLHRITSQSFLKRRTGESFQGSFLNGNGSVISLFTAHLTDNEVWLFVEHEALEKTLKTLEKFHFSEDLAFSIKENYNFAEIRSREALDFGSNFGDFKTVIPLHNWGMFGFLVAYTEVQFAKLKERFKQITLDHYNALQGSFGYPRDQVDIGEQNIILEGPLESFVSRNKGCYPGQEVIERIFTYGNVAKRIVKLNLVGEAAQVSVAGLVGKEILRENQRVGILSSVHKIGDRWFGIGCVQRLALEKAQLMKIKDSDFSCEVSSSIDA